MVDLDGLVAAADPPPDDAAAADRIAAWSAEILRRAREASAQTEIGEAREVVVASTSGTILSRTLGPGYALVVVLEPDAVLGRARYEARLEADRLASEIEG